MKKVDRLFVGPELFEKRPVVGRGVGDSNQFGPHLADVSDLFGELRRRLAGFRPKTERFQTIAFRVLETDRPAGRPACFFVPVGAERNPVERDSTRLRRFPPRGCCPWPPALLPSRDCPSYKRVARRRVHASQLSEEFGRFPRRAMVQDQESGGRVHPSIRPIVDRRERVLARPEDRTAWVFCVRAARTLPSYRAAPFVPAYLHHPAQRNDPPTSKSANALLPFGPFLDEGCERPERLGGRGPLLDDGRKSSHRLGGCRGEFREGQTMTATLAWGCGFEPTFCRVARSILFCPVPNPEQRFVTKSFDLESPQPESE